MVNGSSKRLYIWLAGSAISLALLRYRFGLASTQLPMFLTLGLPLAFQASILCWFFVTPVPMNLGVWNGHLIVRILAAPLLQRYGKEAERYVRFVAIEPAQIVGITALRSVVHYPQSMRADWVEVKETLRVELTKETARDLSNVIADLDARRRHEGKLTLWLAWDLQDNVVGIDWESRSRPSLGDTIWRLRSTPELAGIPIDEKESTLDLRAADSMPETELWKNMAELCNIDREKVAAFVIMALKNVSAEESLRMVRAARTAYCRDEPRGGSNWACASEGNGPIHPSS